MDIPRKSAARRRRIRNIIYAVLGLAAIAGISLGLSKLKPAAPTVERATVWVDTVKRGPMLRNVRGLGTLVPVDIRWIPAVTAGGEIASHRARVAEMTNSPSDSASAIVFR